MLTKAALVVVARAVSITATFGQPKSSYSRSNGPSEICGITADSPSDFRKQVAKSKKYKLTNKSDRFEVYTADAGSQWVFTRSGDPAHPFATCRNLIERDGALYMEREVRCGASRKACDSLVAEFEALDERVRQDVRKGLGK